MTVRPDPLALLPRPRTLTRRSEARAWTPDLPIDARHDPSAGPAGAYRLEMPTSGPVTIIAADASGERSARATLAQIIRASAPADGRSSAEIPCVEISDAPAFATRGFMLDISRNKVPTMDSLRALVDLLASLKFNHLQLYTEHTFAYAGHEDAWRDASPITPDEARDLDAYCLERGIDLVPNQNCFGHLASWLKLERYRDLAETHGDWMFLDMPRSGPFSLCPTDPRSVEFVDDLLSQLLPCFSSGLVNIGCDETYDVGHGRSRAAVDERGRAAVYFDFVTRVCSIAERLGRRPLIWADIALSDPDALDQMPAGAVGISWWYEPETPFAEACDALARHGIEAWVCPGTSSWRSITGRGTERRVNILRAAHDGAAHGATGLLLADWGDSGHHQQWPITLAALGLAAEACWNGASADVPDPHAASLHVFGDEHGRLQPWLDDLADADHHIRDAGRIHNSSAIFNDLYQPPGPKPVDATADAFAEVERRLNALGPAPVAPGTLFADELAHTLELAALAARWGRTRRIELTPQDRLAFADELAGLRDRHEPLWLRRNRPGGLREATAVYDGIINRIRAGDDA